MRRIIILALLLCLAGGKAQAESEIVYQTIAMESADQSAEGQEAVAGVIIERSRASGRSLEAECLRAWQFSCWNSKAWARTWLKRHYGKSTRARAVSALERARNANGAMVGVRHYHTKGVKPAWAKGQTPCLVVGDHYFYRGIK